VYLAVMSSLEGQRLKRLVFALLQQTANQPLAKGYEVRAVLETEMSWNTRSEVGWPIERGSTLWHERRLTGGP
jgi:hypothetical protein